MLGFGRSPNLSLAGGHRTAKLDSIHNSFIGPWHTGYRDISKRSFTIPNGADLVLDYLLLIVFPGAMAFAATMDLITMTIPNRISIILVAAFFVLAPLAGLGLYDMSLHVAAGCVALAAGFLFFSRGWMGGGDAKLCAAAALWLGFEHLADFVLVSALLGGALTLALLFVRKFPLPAILVRQDWIARLHSLEQGIPYGIALGTAGLIVYPWTPWMQPLLH